MRALIGLGGNLGTPDEVVQRFAQAVEALRARLPVRGLRASGLYLSDPVGPVAEQPRFVNAVVALELGGPVAPVSILAELVAVEAELGRVRGQQPDKGPRTIDLDLLFVDRLVLAHPGPPALVLPHPEASRRAFVLVPLGEIMGEAWVVPGVEKTIAECLEASEVRSQGIERMGERVGERPGDRTDQCWFERIGCRNDGVG